MTAMTIDRREVCGTPLPLSTVWIEAKDGRGCRLDYKHEGKHLVEVQRLGAMNTPSDRFTYRARFGGLW